MFPLQELQTQQAAERLAQRLHIKIGNFNPEGATVSSTAYPLINFRYDHQYMRHIVYWEFRFRKRING